VDVDLGALFSPLGLHLTDFDEMTLDGTISKQQVRGC
jgi:hypothetical protein